MRSYSQLNEFDLLFELDLDLWPRPFKSESLPDLNIAINPWEFHHSTTKIVVRKLSTNRQINKQTDKQTNRGENNTFPTSLAEVIIIIIMLIWMLAHHQPPAPSSELVHRRSIHKVTIFIGAKSGTFCDPKMGSSTIHLRRSSPPSHHSQLIAGPAHRLN